MIDDITMEDVPTESHNEKKILERCIALMGQWLMIAKRG